MPKSMKKRSYKKRKASRKNIKRISIKKMKHAHKKHLAHHRLKAKHKTHRSRLGGAGCMCGGKKMKGGMVSSPASGPVGYSWDGGDIGTWPGASASQGLNTNGAVMSNHFKLSPNGIVVGGLNPARSTTDDQLMTPPMNGGRKRKGKGKKQKGGGFFQELLNLGRGAQYNIQGVGYGLAGKHQPISQNPFPTESQPIDGDFKFIGGQPPDVRKIFIDANNQVAQI